MNNTLDLSKYTIEDFKRFSIFELRDIAAFYGVKAPTSHSKGDLVILIDQARNSGGHAEETADGVAKPKRGRPSKAAQKAYVDARLTTDDYYSTDYKQTSNEVVSMISEPSITYSNYTEDIIKFTPRGGARNFANLTDAAVSFASGETKEYSGILELNPKGFGFLRAKYCGNDATCDAHIDIGIIRGLHLRSGDYIKGLGKKEYEDKSATLIYVLEVNGVSVEKVDKRPFFDTLVPIYPEEKFILEAKTGRSETSIRCIDLIAPIGKGQRALIVSPPKAGKTTLLKQIANSITTNYPNVKVFVLLVDERPEEVTDMQRSIHADVIFSTFDEQPEHHIKIAETVLESAKRYVESGKDAVIVLDSLTRLARAYNATVEHSGRALSGGLDPTALSAPKRFFGSARNIENGGSLTIIATALIDTGSRLDDVIFEEFKGTGNMEVVLDRNLSEKRIFPAIDLAKSGTRRDDLLLSSEEMTTATSIRTLLDTNSADTLNELINEIYSSKNNAEFIQNFNKRMDKLKTNGYTYIANKNKY